MIVENHKLPLVSYYTYFDVGGKFETPGITGSSHFLEHMMFKGAKKYPEGEFDKMVEGVKKGELPPPPLPPKKEELSDFNKKLKKGLNYNPKDDE